LRAQHRTELEESIHEYLKVKLGDAKASACTASYNLKTVPGIPLALLNDFKDWVSLNFDSELRRKKHLMFNNDAESTSTGASNGTSDSNVSKDNQNRPQNINAGSITNSSGNFSHINLNKNTSAAPQHPVAPSSNFNARPIAYRPIPYPFFHPSMPMLHPHQSPHQPMQLQMSIPMPINPLANAISQNSAVSAKPNSTNSTSLLLPKPLPVQASASSNAAGGSSVVTNLTIADELKSLFTEAARMKDLTFELKDPPPLLSNTQPNTQMYRAWTDVIRGKYLNFTNPSAICFQLADQFIVKFNIKRVVIVPVHQTATLKCALGIPAGYYKAFVVFMERHALNEIVKSSFVYRSGKFSRSDVYKIIAILTIISVSSYGRKL
jgi:hypothetical protein